MTTKLNKTIKRELDLLGRVFTILISPNGVKITPKGGRTGQEISWEKILTDEFEIPTPQKTPPDA